MIEMKDLIQKYKNDSLTPEELVEFRQWLENSDDDTIAEAFGMPYNLDSYAAVRHDAVIRMKKKIDDAISQDISSGRRSMRFLRIFSAVAAVTIPVLVLACVYLYLSRPAARVPGDAICTVSTRSGEKSTVTLPDGSVVMLNGMSRLSFPSDMNDSVRNVEFTGEAYFSVSHDPGHPFRINTGKMIVKVFGTSFSLTARETSDCCGLKLDHGAVELISTANHKTVKLQPGEMAVFDKTSDSFTVEVAPKPATVTVAQTPAGKASARTAPENLPQPVIPSWNFSGLRFDNAAPDSLVSCLERTYGVDIDSSVVAAINDSFTGTLPDDDLYAALLILSRIYEFNMPFSMHERSEPEISLHSARNR